MEQITPLLKQKFVLLLGLNPLCQLPLSASCSVAQQLGVSSFSSTLSGSEVHLSWQIENVSPDAVFEVQKMAGTAFVSIGEIRAVDLIDFNQRQPKY